MNRERVENGGEGNMTEDREPVGYHKKQEKRKAREQRRARLLQGMLCLCMVVVCVGTAVLAVDALSDRK